MTTAGRCAACDKSLGPIAGRARMFAGPEDGVRRMEIALVVEIPDGDDAGERAHELGHRLAEVAEQLGAPFADVYMVDDLMVEEGDERT